MVVGFRRSMLEISSRIWYRFEQVNDMYVKEAECGKGWRDKVGEARRFLVRKTSAS